MKIGFKCRVTGSADQPYVNTAVFKSPDGKEIVLDRDETEYSFKDGFLNMTWRNVYIWDGENCLYVNDDDDARFKSSWIFIGLEIEDDAPEGYLLYDVTAYDGYGREIEKGEHKNG